VEILPKRVGYLWGSGVLDHWKPRVQLTILRRMKTKITELPNKGEVIIYRARDHKIKLEVTLEHETVSLSQKQMANLFGSVIRNFRITAADVGSCVSDEVSAKFSMCQFCTNCNAMCIFCTLHLDND
jgi:hypothetical protein